jgi:serine/threonine protein kinase/Tfp pilus assembly protein PilF
VESERWRQITEIFHRASARPPGERDTLLEQACAGDADLRREVEVLLANDQETRTMLNSPVAAAVISMAAAGERTGRVGRNYEIESKIGEGGMGAVYKARDLNLGRTVALKFLIVSGSADKDAVTRFLREARTLSALDHPNICTIYGIETAEDGSLFIAMAYYEGETLKEKIVRGPVRAAEAVDVAAQTSAGLAKAHSINIVHRDIKPANLMITADGLVKILDFGIAKFADGPGVTRKGSAIGTASYMSPEQVEGGEVDARSDIWSLGVVLYEALAGRSPFTGPTGLATLTNILKNPPPPLGIAGVPPSLEEVILRALSKNPGSRQQSAIEFRAELAEAMEGNRSDIEKVRSRKLRMNPSVAVLPFSAIDGDSEAEAMGDGITGELIFALSQVRDIRVVARTTMFQFKGRPVDLREVGRQLDASVVLEGDVRLRGNRVRITASLISVSDGFQLWTERFDRQFEDIFDVEEEIAKAIVGALIVRFEGAREAPAVRIEANPEAYRHYLKARRHLDLQLSLNLAPVFESLDQALAIDAGYVAAHLTKAEAQLLMGVWGVQRPRDAWASLRESAHKAVELDPASGLAHFFLGTVHSALDWDWPAAHREFERALSLSPAEPRVHTWYASFWLAPQGLLHEALAREIEGLRLDPLSPVAHNTIAWVHVWLKEFEKARHFARQALELAPMSMQARWPLALADIEAGEPDQAVASLEAVMERAGEQSISLSLLVRAAVRAGRPADARRYMDRLLALAEARYVAPTHVAWACGAMGEADLAFQWMEKALEDRDIMVLYLPTAILYDGIRRDPRFQKLVDRVGLSNQSQTRTLT